jgi:predicted nuclease of restriction endonuclease-like (RecB) superfamily
MSQISPNSVYKNWIEDVKKRVRSTQIKAAIAVNSALIEFYWELGKMLYEKQTAWGTGFLENVSRDLKTEFPEISGFSVRNLKYCRKFFEFYGIDNTFDEKRQQLVAQIPWGHNIMIITKLNDIQIADFYLEQTVNNAWSRDTLALQIKSELHKRQGKSINNFQATLPSALSDLAKQTLKDPYVFDFMTMSSQYKEKDIENQLVTHIRKFLLELGKGFAFVGQQYHLEIAESDYYIDLLFYHIKLKCYVVIELKNSKFIPEFAGKLNFYLSAVDSLLKDDNDKPTIGILLCRDKNNIEAEFSLRDIQKPMGVTEFQLTNVLPDELKSSLPTIEEIEQNLTDTE